MGRRCPEGHITDLRDTRMVEMGIRQRKMEASSERGQGPQGGRSAKYRIESITNDLISG